MDRKIPHTTEQLTKIFHKDGIEEKHFPKFLDYYKTGFEELYNDYKDYEEEDWEDDDESISSIALENTYDFIEPYLELVKKGHGEEWAHSIAYSQEDRERAVFHAYNEVLEIDKELAQKELLIYTKSFGEDEYFEKFYLKSFAEVADPEGRVEAAQNFSKIYKTQLKNGKSEVYAEKYADLMAGPYYHEIYCEDYAIAFDNAIKNNKNELYASVYADKYASALVDIKRRYGISDDEEMMDFAVEKVNAFMHAWEYSQENKVDDFESFERLYENIHLNTYYADEGRPNLSNEEIDQLVLKETLEKFSN